MPPGLLELREKVTVYVCVFNFRWQLRINNLREKVRRGSVNAGWSWKIAFLSSAEIYRNVVRYRQTPVDVRRRNK